MEERIQKIISAYGAASRREAERLLEQGRIRVNGNTAHLGESADPDEDVIEIDGKALRKKPKPVYLMLHKPRGFVTTLHDEKGRRTAAELVADCGVRVYPIGRLDLYSEGLLLFTNDGALADRLMHPRSETEKEYLVWVTGWTDGALRALSSPIELDGKLTAQADAKIIRQDGSSTLVSVTIHEGRNRQVRRMCAAAGLTVTRLLRVREGSIRLGDLPRGKWRYLTNEELASLGV